VVAHHTWIPRTGVGAVKRIVLRLARNLAVSEALATSLPVPAEVVPNPYAHTLFRRLADVPRDADLVFVGRLVSDKGAPVVLRALQILHARGLPLWLTIIGDGPDKPALHQEAVRLGLAASVRFTGALQGEVLVLVLNRHRLCVVPSVWEEPFGLVALEALACGCVPVVARSGGLPGAVGPCGVVVSKGDAAALADALELLHADAARRAALLAQAEAHLAAHQAAAVARRYLAVLSDVQRRDRAVRTA
jgi:glycogen synthase